MMRRRTWRDRSTVSDEAGWSSEGGSPGRTALSGGAGTGTEPPRLVAEDGEWGSIVGSHWRGMTVRRKEGRWARRGSAKRGCPRCNRKRPHNVSAKLRGGAETQSHAGLLGPTEREPIPPRILVCSCEV